MKIYIFSCYVPYNSNDNMVCAYEALFDDQDDGFYAAVYAWTHDKKLAERYRQVHSKNYLYMREKSIDKDTYSEFLKLYRDLEIRYIEYTTSITSSVNILSTEWEHNIVINCSYEELSSYMTDLLQVDYTLLKGKYIDALDSLSYTTLYDSLVGGDLRFNDINSVDSRIDCASFNMSYNLTIGGRTLYSLMDSEFLVYCKLFIGFISGGDITSLIK